MDANDNEPRSLTEEPPLPIRQNKSTLSSSLKHNNKVKIVFFREEKEWNLPKK